MTVINNKIISATEFELKKYWLSRGFGDVIPFDVYARLIQKCGTIIIKE